MSNFRLTHNVIMEMDGILEDADASSSDPHLRHMAEVDAAIKSGKRVKGGVVITLDTVEAIHALWDEAAYREEFMRDSMYDAWDATDMLRAAAVARSFAALQRRCADALSD
jgi:hypothetical protein